MSSLEIIKDQKSLAIRWVLIVMVALFFLNECTYQSRSSSYQSCMADEADDIFVNYDNCTKPKP